MDDLRKFIQQHFFDNNWARHAELSNISEEKLSTVNTSFSNLDVKSKLYLLLGCSDTSLCKSPVVNRCVESIFLQALNEDNTLVKAVATILDSKRSLNFLNFDISATNESFNKNIERLLKSSDSLDTVSAPLLAEFLGEGALCAYLNTAHVVKVPTGANRVHRLSDPVLSCTKPDKPLFRRRGKPASAALKNAYLEKLKDECQRRRIHVPIPGRSFARLDDSDEPASAVKQTRTPVNDIDGSTSNRPHINTSSKVPASRPALHPPNRNSSAWSPNRGTNSQNLPKNGNNNNSTKSLSSRDIRTVPLNDHLPTNRALNSTTGAQKASKIKLLDFNELPAFGPKAKLLKKEEKEKERELKRQQREERQKEQRAAREAAKQMRLAERQSLLENRRRVAAFAAAEARTMTTSGPGWPNSTVDSELQQDSTDQSELEAPAKRIRQLVPAFDDPSDRLAYSSQSVSLANPSPFISQVLHPSPASSAGCTLRHPLLSAYLPNHQHYQQHQQPQQTKQLHQDGILSMPHSFAVDDDEEEEEEEDEDNERERDDGVFRLGIAPGFRGFNPSARVSFQGTFINPGGGGGLPTLQSASSTQGIAFCAPSTGGGCLLTSSGQARAPQQSVIYRPAEGMQMTTALMQSSQPSTLLLTSGGSVIGAAAQSLHQLQQSQQQQQKHVRLLTPVVSLASMGVTSSNALTTTASTIRLVGSSNGSTATANGIATAAGGNGSLLAQANSLRVVQPTLTPATSSSTYCTAADPLPTQPGLQPDPGHIRLFASLPQGDQSMQRLVVGSQQQQGHYHSNNNNSTINLLQSSNQSATISLGSLGASVSEAVATTAGTSAGAISIGGSPIRILPRMAAQLIRLPTGKFGLLQACPTSSLQGNKSVTVTVANTNSLQNTISCSPVPIGQTTGATGTGLLPQQQLMLVSPSPAQTTGQPPVNYVHILPRLNTGLVVQSVNQQGHLLPALNVTSSTPLACATDGQAQQLQILQQRQQQQQQQQYLTSDYQAQVGSQSVGSGNEMVLMVAPPVVGGGDTADGRTNSSSSAMNIQDELCLTEAQVSSVQSLFQGANRVSRPEKAMIISFIAGARGNPHPETGNTLRIRLSEYRERVLNQSTGQLMDVAADTYLHMDYATGQCKKDPNQDSFVGPLTRAEHEQLHPRTDKPDLLAEVDAEANEQIEFDRTDEREATQAAREAWAPLAPPFIDAHFSVWHQTPSLSSSQLYLGGRLPPPASAGAWAAPLRRDFSADDYDEELEYMRRRAEAEIKYEIGEISPVRYAIHVQVASSYSESLMISSLAEDYYFIAGYVSWIDLSDPSLSDHLQKMNGDPLLVGLRYDVSQIEGEYLLDPMIDSSFSAIERLGLPFDLSVAPHQLRHACHLAYRHPKLKLVLDHCGLPVDYTAANRERCLAFTSWCSDLDYLSRYPNVFCKVTGATGLPTTASGGGGTPGASLSPSAALAHAIGSFGPDRCLFGSGWPLCRLVTPQQTGWPEQASAAVSSEVPGEMALKRMRGTVPLATLNMWEAARLVEHAMGEAGYGSVEDKYKVFSTNAQSLYSLTIRPYGACPLTLH